VTDASAKGRSHSPAVVATAPSAVITAAAACSTGQSIAVPTAAWRSGIAEQYNSRLGLRMLSFLAADIVETAAARRQRPSDRRLDGICDLVVDLIVLNRWLSRPAERSRLAPSASQAGALPSR